MRAAVLGQPISHSLSPFIHNAAYAALGLPHQFSTIECNEESFRHVLDSCDEAWMGLSLTMPLKESAFLVADTITPVALLARSANTLLFTDKIHADNTDVYGVVQAVREHTDTRSTRAIIIGSGATARSAIVACSELGITSIDLIARNPKALRECGEIAQKLDIAATATDPREAIFTETTLTINATPAGVADGLVSVLKRPAGAILDVVYHPWPSAITKHWLDAGLVAVPGHSMLLHQAVKQFQLMTGVAAPVDVMRHALEEQLHNRK
jgi:shikimate dehydrogenase